MLCRPIHAGYSFRGWSIGPDKSRGIEFTVRHCNFTLKRSRFRNNAYPGISSSINELKNSVIRQKYAQMNIFCQISLSFHFGKLFGLHVHQHSIIKLNCNKREKLRVFQTNHGYQFNSPRKYPEIEVIIQKEAASIKFPLSLN